MLSKTEIELQNFCQVTDLKRMIHGVANEVYEAKQDGKRYVLKYYQKDPNFALIDRLMDRYRHFKIASPKVLSVSSFNNRTVLIYPYIEGRHLLDLTEERIEKILRIIQLGFDDLMETYDQKESVFAKYQMYYQYFMSHSTNRIDPKQMEQILLRSNSLMGQTLECSIVHGDLSPYNILWQGEEPIILDLDECVVAPVYYELVVFLIKYCFHQGKFNLEQGQMILKKYRTMFSKTDLTELINHWYFYITKVLLEKIYYYELGYIDLEDENQSKDSFRWWLDLLQNDMLLQQLFFKRS